MTGPSARARAVQAPIIPQVADWVRAHPGTLSLGQGVAGYGPPPEIHGELSRLDREPLLHRYQPVEGLPELRSEVAGRWERRHGIRLGTDRDLLITAGANAAFLQVVLALCDPGDEVLLTLPYYFNQEMAVALAGARPVCVPPGPGFHPDPDALAAAVTSRTRMVVTVSPNNPTGAVCPVGILREVNALCARRGLVHVSDETYEDFTWDGAPHVSPCGFPGSEPHTIRLFSFSKSFGLAGWRVGGCVFPKPLHETLRKIQDTNVICAPVPGQLAAVGCLRAPDSWLAGHLADLDRTRSAVLATLAGLDDRVEIAPAHGAFYVWLRVAGDPDPVALARWLVERHRVAVIPGSAFGMTSGGWLRIAYGALAPGTAAEGAGRLVAGIREWTDRGGKP